jgi:prepilin-type N-terminal cleavage/methylation domain-containing protein
MERIGPRGMTIWEVVVVLVVLAVLGAIILPCTGGPTRAQARNVACTNNQRQLALAAIIYAQDHDGQLPLAATVWADIIKQDTGSGGVLRDPDAGALANGYVYNSTLSGKKLGDPARPEASRIFVSADGQHNTADGKQPNVAYTMADIDTSRHKLEKKSFLFTRQVPGFAVSYLDGHVATLPADAVPQLIP